MIKNIAIFASGEGTNAQTIIDYFKSSQKIKIALVVSNKSTANVLNRAKNNNITTLIIDKHSFCETNEVIDVLKKSNIDLIVLAGFLWMIPENLVKAFPNKIVNIHPALLPKYGGKGMYGINVHKAVLENKETETGVTIHYVNKNYDEGEFIFQKSVSIIECKSAEEIATKIHYLEMDNFPKVIEQLISK